MLGQEPDNPRGIEFPVETKGFNRKTPCGNLIKTACNISNLGYFLKDRVDRQRQFTVFCYYIDRDISIKCVG